MTAINSKIRMDLPSAPSTNNPEAFNELLIVYNALRVLHAQTSRLLGQESLTSDELQSLDGLQEFYTIGNFSRLPVRAASAITAGRFVETTGKTGEIFNVRHVSSFTSHPAYGFCYLGLVLEDLAVGKVGFCYTAPSIISGFSGLTPGQLYVTNTSGQLAVPTNFAQNLYVGLALSASDIRLGAVNY